MAPLAWLLFALASTACCRRQVMMTTVTRYCPVLPLEPLARPIERVDCPEVACYDAANAVRLGRWLSDMQRKLAEYAEQCPPGEDQ